MTPLFGQNTGFRDVCFTHLYLPTHVPCLKHELNPPVKMSPQQKWEFCRHQLLWTDQLESTCLHSGYSTPCSLLHAACSQEVSSLWQPDTAIHTIITNMKKLSNIPDGLLIEVNPLICWSNVCKTINLVAVAYHHCLWIVGTVCV